jgi:hypothetical protein
MGDAPRVFERDDESALLSGPPRAVVFVLSACDACRPERTACPRGALELTRPGSGTGESGRRKQAHPASAQALQPDRPTVPRTRERPRCKYRVGRAVRPTLLERS